ncbi:MAG: hypothetical protein CMI09_09200 [Oceanospirillaceae bacterium]|nr:hypothetical protein [Oceanospirillaceae bacterium]|tara:strand:- start:248 stop:916 length:669 start_codon:yes stop_codon:yes gene_type:complete
MSTTTVKTIIDRVKNQLLETTTEGVRWNNEELLGWLNDFYQFACMHLPDRFADVRTFSCVAGTRQDLPADMEQLLDVVRNMDGNLRAVRKVDRRMLDQTRPEWHSEAASTIQEGWCFDDMFPKVFYVTPPATAGSTLEISGSVVPIGHVIADYNGGTVTIKCPDNMAPAAIDYILARSYGKDADYSGNAVREQNAMNRAMTALGLSQQVRFQTSPNNSTNDR